MIRAIQVVLYFLAFILFFRGLDTLVRFDESWQRGFYVTLTFGFAMLLLASNGIIHAINRLHDALAEKKPKPSDVVQATEYPAVSPLPSL
jgi:hypothetical protein